ncbi:MAG: peptidylprolyl isomerase [Proteobacteria bacterium]|nr:peptidylprolyl isomerase [Pseudomonadota bacterium]
MRSPLLFASVLILLGACDRGSGAGGAAPPEAGDTAVARVGGSAIYASDVKREAVAQGQIGAGEPLDTSSPLFRRLLDEVVDQRLLSQEAVRRGLDDDPATQRRLAAARERVLADTLVENVVAGATNEAAIRALYDDTQRLQRRSEEIRARQIVTGTEAEARTVLGQLAAGASFEQLAMERSTDAATRFNGGDLGYFTLDIMPEPYAVALQGAAAGRVVGPFRTDAGWVLLRMEDRRPEQPNTLEEVRPQLVRFLTFDRIRQLLEELRGKAEIDVLLEGGARTQEPASAPGATGRAAVPPRPAGAGAVAPGQTAPAQTAPAQTAPSLAAPASPRP